MIIGSLSENDLLEIHEKYKHLATLEECRKVLETSERIKNEENLNLIKLSIEVPTYPLVFHRFYGVMTHAISEEDRNNAHNALIELFSPNYLREMKKYGRKL